MTHLIIKTQSISCCPESSWESEPQYFVVSECEWEEIGNILKISEQAKSIRCDAYWTERKKIISHDEHNVAYGDYGCGMCGEYMDAVWLRRIYEQSIVLYQNPSIEIIKVIDKINAYSKRSKRITKDSIYSIMNTVVDKLKEQRKKIEMK